MTPELSDLIRALLLVPLIIGFAALLIVLYCGLRFLFSSGEPTDGYSSTRRRQNLWKVPK